jgi:hypothetical protein
MIPLFASAIHCQVHNEKFEIISFIVNVFGVGQGIEKH